METYNLNIKTIDCIIKISQLMESLRTTKVGKIRELRTNKASILAVFAINHDDATFDTAIKIIKLNQLKNQINNWGGDDFLVLERNVNRANSLESILSGRGLIIEN
jgi:hypothetical protein